MDFDFIEDERWKDLDEGTRSAVLDAAFERDIASDPEWGGLDDDTKEAVRGEYLNQARAFEGQLEIPDERSAIGSVGAGLTHGAIGLLETVGTATQWAGERLGSETITDIGKTSSDYWEKKAKKYGPSKDIDGKNLWDNPEILADIDYWLYNVSDMVPMLAASVVPGTAAAKGVQAVTSIPKLAKIAGAVTGGFFGGGMEGAQTYKAVLEKGGTEEQAARSAELMTLGAGVLNALGVGKILSKAGAGFKGKVIKTLGASAWEGITEGLEEPTEVFAKYFGAYLSGQELPDNLKQQLVESAKDAITVAPIAAITGGGAALLSGEGYDENDKAIRDNAVKDIGAARSADEAIDAFNKATEPKPVELTDEQAKSILQSYGVPIPEMAMDPSRLLPAGQGFELVGDRPKGMEIVPSTAIRMENQNAKDQMPDPEAVQGSELSEGVQKGEEVGAFIDSWGYPGIVYAEKDDGSVKLVRIQTGDVARAKKMLKWLNKKYKDRAIIASRAVPDDFVSEMRDKGLISVYSREEIRRRLSETTENQNAKDQMPEPEAQGSELPGKGVRKGEEVAAPTKEKKWYRVGNDNEYSEFTFPTRPGSTKRMSGGRGTGYASGMYAFSSPGEGRTEVEPPKNPLKIKSSDEPKDLQDAAISMMRFAEGQEKGYAGQTRGVVGLVMFRYSPKQSIDETNKDVEWAIEKWKEHKKVHPMNILLNKWGYDGVEFVGKASWAADSGDYGNVKFPPITEDGDLVDLEPHGSIYMRKKQTPSTKTDLPMEEEPARKPETGTNPAPEKETPSGSAPVSAPKAKGAGVRTVRGRIKQLGGINFLNFKGEKASMPTGVKFLSRKDGMPVDLVEQTLKDEGWMRQDEDLLESLRDPVKSKEFLKRRPGNTDIMDRSESDLTESEKRLKEEMEWEPESPPEGEYVQVNAQDLPEDKELTIIGGNSIDGWDTYRVIDKDPFGITLKDGTTVELAPLDKVEVRKEDIEPGKTGEVWKNQEKSGFQLKRESLDLKKSELKSKAQKTKQQGLGLPDPNQPNLFGEAVTATEDRKQKEAAAKKPKEDQISFQEKIGIKPAIRLPDGRIMSGLTHSGVFSKMTKAEKDGKYDEGWADREGNWVTNKEARDLINKPTEEVQNDRDAFAVERVNPETDGFEPITFRRGEHIKAWINKDSWKEGPIDGISHARKEFKVGNIWFEFEKAFKTDQPKTEARRPEPTTPLSKVVEATNEENEPPGGFDESDKVSAVKDLENQKEQDYDKPEPDILKESGLVIEKGETKRGKPVWYVKGNTFEHKESLKAAGAKWNRFKKAWSFYDGDPTAKISATLNGQGNAESVEQSGDSKRSPEKVLRAARRREDARADERATSEDLKNYVSNSTARLIRIGKKFGIPRQVLKEQIEDVAQINKAFQDKKSLFLLANEPGTGKTFVIGGAIREIQKADPKAKAIWVTMNQRLIDQIKSDLSKYGIDDVEFVTYSDLSNNKNSVDFTDAVVFWDESQNVKNVASKRGKKAQRYIDYAKFNLFASATPFENPVEMAYLEPTGMFDSAGGFVNFAKMYGAATRKIKEGYGKNKRIVKEIPYWTGGKKEDGAAARKWVFKQGIMTQRNKRIEPEKVDTSFHKTDASPEYVELYNKVNAAFDDAVADWEHNEEFNAMTKAQIAMQQVNTLKRILEGAKINAAIDRIKSHIKDGKQVVVFVETKSDRKIGNKIPYDDMISIMGDWEMERRGGLGAGKRPFTDAQMTIAHYFDEYGIDFQLPSTVDEIVRAFGKDQVSVYVGANKFDAVNVTAKSADTDLDAWKAGKKPVLVATMAKGGTGLSLHPTEEGNERIQIGLNLPWKATGVDQVSGRLARYGLKSDIGIEWLFAPNLPIEQMIAQRVGTRMRDMGAVVKGLKVDAAEKLADFDFESGQAIKSIAGKSDVIRGEEVEEGDVYAKAERMERLERKASDTSKGFFQTPYKLSALMTKISGVQSGDAVLEPSAGHGRLLEFLPEGVHVKAVEVRNDNAKVLEKKFPKVNRSFSLTKGDFTDVAIDLGKFDTILMNPPFERKKGLGPQDAKHVHTAYHLLNPNGRLVAIMGEGVFFRNYKQEKEFRTWLDDVGAIVIQLPENTFKKSGTGVRARMVVIDKNDISGRDDLVLDTLDDLQQVEGWVAPRERQGGGEPLSDRAAFHKRQSPYPGPGVSADILSTIMAEPIEQWPNKPEIKIVQSQDELPISILSQVKKGEFVDGALFNGTAYIVADNVGSVHNAWDTLLHEVYGHYGFRGLFDDSIKDSVRYRTILNRIYKAKTAEVRQVAKDSGLDIQRKEDRLAAAEEWLADEAAKLHHSTWVNRAIRAIREFIRKLGIDLQISNAEIRAWLADARKFVQKGDKPYVNVVPAFAKIQQAAKKITDNPNFRRWFGDSKVVDENGEPLVVYHGTTYTDIERFLPEGGREGDWQRALDFFRNKVKRNDQIGYMNFRSGTFFSPKPEYAGNYTSENTGVMYPVYIKAENPIYLSMGKKRKVWGVDPNKTADALILVDGDGSINEIAVIDPTQIKSIFNKGTFDPKDDRIAFKKHTPEKVLEKDTLSETFDVPGGKPITESIKSVFKGSNWTKDRAKSHIDSMRTAVIDRLHPIEALGRIPYQLHRMLGNTHLVVGTFLEHGKLSWKDNALTVESKGEGFLPWLRSLGDDGRNFFYWMATKRAEVLEGEGRENWLTPEKRKAIQDEIFSGLNKKDRKAKEREYRKLNRQFQKWNRNIIDIAKESGLLSDEQIGAWTRDFYLPFYRIFENESARDDFFQGPRKSKKYISAQIKRLKGGEEKIGDPVENILRNWFHLVQESQRNKARQSAAEVAIGEGIAETVENKDLVKILGSQAQRKWAVRRVGKTRAAKAFDVKADAEAYRDLMGDKYEIVEQKTTMVKFGRKEDFQIVTYQDNGKTIHLRVNDPALFEAMAEVNVKAFDGLAMKTMMGAKRLLTAGATFSPAFRIANLLRDTVHTAVVTKNFRPFVDSFVGAVKVWKENPEYIELMASGGGFGKGWIESGDPKAAANAIQKIIRREGKDSRWKILNTPRMFLDFWERVGHASEMAARVQLYSNLRQKGESHLEASFRAKDILDFHMSGAANAVRTLNAIVPFVNARVQGLDRLYRGAKEDKRAFFTKGAMVTAASLMLWALFSDDERYKELEDWEKWQYHHFWIGDTHFRIPKAFEIGAIFSSLFESAANTLSGNEDFKFFGRFIGHTLTETFSMSPPALFAPMIEVYANKSFFTGRPIEGMSLQRLPAGDRSKPWTPDLLKDLGKGLNLSPTKMEHIIRGYTATYGAMWLTVADSAYRNITGKPSRPAMRIQDAPAIGRFMRERGGSTKYANRWYDFASEVQELTAAINHHKSLGDAEAAIELTRKNADSLKYKKFVSRINRALSSLRKREKAAWASAETAAQKRDILKRIDDRKREIYKMAYEAVYESK